MPVFKTAEDIAKACRRAGFFYCSNQGNESYHYLKKLKNGRTLEARIYEENYGNKVVLEFRFPCIKKDNKEIFPLTSVEYVRKGGFLLPKKTSLVERPTLQFNF